ncbi:MAG: hypothetical protein WCI72_04675 [archaeon]
MENEQLQTQRKSKSIANFFLHPIGTKEQRTKREEELIQEAANLTLPEHVMKIILEPGYVFRREIYSQQSLGEKALGVFVGAYITALQGTVTSTIATKLGEYFS